MNVEDVVSRVLEFHRTSMRRLHLIPSENMLSVAARLPFLTDLVYRYSFPTESGENWSWPGNGDLAAIEHAAADGLRDLFRARYVNVKPISGLNCMAVAISAFAEAGATLLSIDESDGGHGATRFMAQRLGVTHHPLPYDRTLYRVDAERLAALARSIAGPKVVYLDQFMCLFPHDLAEIRAAVGDDTLIHYDGSHVLGLIAGGQFQDPLREGADCLAGSTHKSFPGPHKGVVLTNDEQLAVRVDEHASHWVSHHHPADVAALAIAVAELRDEGSDYAARTVRNAQHLASTLAEQGFAVCGAELGYTRSHQVWIDIAPILDPWEASQRLLAAGIVVNAIDVPYLAGSTGLRLGVQEATRLGMDTADMAHIARLFKQVLISGAEARYAAAEVQALLDAHPLLGGDQIEQQLAYGVRSTI